MLRVGIVAGEASGDYLGANLIKSLKGFHGDIVVEGIGGEKMQEEGCLSIYPMDKLSVMGVIEALDSYLELSRMRRSLIEHFSNNPPDVFIGIDAPDFNLGLEQSLRKEGVRTVHYVSPSVWAWRKYRVKKIARSVDLMLTLFPFELDIYKQHNIPALCVGHPLAEKISMQPNKVNARERIDVGEDITIIGIMPGSRKGEIARLWPVFLQTANLCYKQSSDIIFISSLLASSSVEYCKQIQREMSLEHLPIIYYVDRVHDVLEASDVLLLASGTITLEAMLFKRPMVVAYKLHPVTHFLMKFLTYIEHASLPNLLADREIVPECLQNNCYSKRLYFYLQEWLNNPDKIAGLQGEFTKIHKSLKNDNKHAAARAVLKLIGQIT